MKSVLLFGVGWILLFPQLASGGPLYGTIRIGQAPAAQVEILVECPATGSRQALRTRAVTDSRGSFSLRVQASGRCLMRVRRDALQGEPFEVFVADNPIRFDVVLDNELKRVR